MHDEGVGLVDPGRNLLRSDNGIGSGIGAEINRPPCDQVPRDFCKKHCCAWHGTWCACEAFHPAGPDGIKRCARTYDDIRNRTMKDEMERRG
ncbi:MAG: hypothetical protein WC340_15905 [Kiritimatiellia bacterium]